METNQRTSSAWHRNHHDEMDMSMASALIEKPAPCGLQRIGIISPTKLPPRRRSSARRGTTSDPAHVASDSNNNNKIRDSCCSSRITNTARNGVDSYARAFHAAAASSAAMPATSGSQTHRMNPFILSPVFFWCGSEVLISSSYPKARRTRHRTCLKLYLVSLLQHCHGIDFLGVSLLQP